METTKFVVAVTHHVFLMVNLLLLPMELVVFALSKVAFDSSALTWLFSSL